MNSARLMLDPKTRNELWRRVFEAIEAYTTKVDTVRVTPELNPEKIRSLLEHFDFSKPVDPLEAANFVIDALWQYQIHTPHPRYFGLFNPAPTTISIAADTGAITRWPLRPNSTSSVPSAAGLVSSKPRAFLPPGALKRTIPPCSQRW